jgi:prepilin-type N-terminal cleavage/methylation domain-containing protein
LIVRRSSAGFTIVELLVVMAIILVLAGLILATSSYVQKKGARSRAEAEIAAISAALENYKADNGIYPSDANTTDKLDPLADTNPAVTPIPNAYTKANLYLYEQITGDSSANRQQTGKAYISFKPGQLSPPDGSSAVQFIRDPFGNSYGYSTMKASGGPHGYNPTFDLWCTATETDQSRWIKNW